MFCSISLPTPRVIRRAHLTISPTAPLSFCLRRQGLHISLPGPILRFFIANASSALINLAKQEWAQLCLLASILEMYEALITRSRRYMYFPVFCTPCMTHLVVFLGSLPEQEPHLSPLRFSRGRMGFMEFGVPGSKGSFRFQKYVNCLARPRWDRPVYGNNMCLCKSVSA